MSWRDQYQTGSFRGVPFRTVSHSHDFGRRVQVHEYPGRDLPYPEDLGRKARAYSIDCILLGDNYFTDRDRFREALEQKGPGVLIHPYLGRMQVQVQECSLSESTEEGGKATFRVQFVEASGAPAPDVVPDSSAKLASAAESAHAAAESEFADNFRIDKLPDFVVESAREIIGDAFDTLTDALSTLKTLPSELYGYVRQVQSLQSGLTAAMLAPAGFAGSMVGLVSGVGGLVSDPLETLSVYRRLWTFGETKAYRTPPTTTAARRQQKTNQAQLVAMVERSAVISAAQAIAEATPYTYTGLRPTGQAPGATGFASYQEAVAARDEITGQIDRQVETADDVLYPALRDLYAAVVTHVGALRPQLACGSVYTSRATLPALALAHRIYGDANREADLCARNHVRHPGFVPGGVPLEILIR
jgi:prophage DNA circulation protein